MRTRAPSRMVSQSEKPSGANTMMVEPCSNQPSSSPLWNAASHGKHVRPLMLQVQRSIETVHADAGNQNGGHGDQRHRLSVGRKLGRDHGALVLAEQALDPLQRDRVDVPGIAGDVDHALDAAVVRCMEAVVHARCQAQASRSGRCGAPRPARGPPAVPPACRESPWPDRARYPRWCRRRPRWRRRG